MSPKFPQEFTSSFKVTASPGGASTNSNGNTNTNNQNNDQASAFGQIIIKATNNSIPSKSGDVYVLDSAKEYYLSIKKGLTPDKISSITLFESDRQLSLFSSSQLSQEYNRGDVYELAKLGSADYQRWKENNADIISLTFSISPTTGEPFKLTPIQVKVEQKCGPEGNKIYNCKTACDTNEEKFSQYTCTTGVCCGKST